MFATQEFIEASRNYVCVRIETYENKESEAMVRKLLNGRFANTAFVILDPQGKQMLTRSGRSPGQSLASSRGRGGDSNPDNGSIISNMNKIAAKFDKRGQSAHSELQDFNTLRQALNVASADQRLLVLANTSAEQFSKSAKKLKSIFSDESIAGRFHFDIVDEKVDTKSAKSIHGLTKDPGLVVIQASQFGLDGKAVAFIDLEEDSETIRKNLLAANEDFSKVESRKDYASHVQAGRRKGIYFENEIPYGEDRDGDGKADQKQNRRRRR